jgi:4a-hydroxytetrahydrobiopterin dehydratase
MWVEENNKLKKSLKFKDFSVTWAFMTEVAIVAEKMNHHPNWKNAYNKLDISLFTHDHDNKVTPKDLELSKAIDKILLHYQVETL